MTPSHPHYDLIVIGSGPGGQRAALQGAKAGKRVAIIEYYEVGGGCVHFGTLPSKSFRESIYRYSLGSRGVLAQDSDDAKRKVEAKPKFEVPEMSRLLRRKDRVVEDETEVISHQLKRNGVELFRGKASFLSKNEVEVVAGKNRKVLRGDIIIIAVGASPIAPNHIDVDGRYVLDSNSILTLKRVPKSMVVLGGGIIGCEYASMFAMAGTKVTLVDKRHEILASVDREIVRALMDRFEYQGMEIILSTEAEKVVRSKSGDNSQATVHLTNGRKVKADVVLVALGRRGNTDELGLEKIGIEVDPRGQLKVDAHFRTSTSNIYAVGDVIGAPALASTSMEQGRIAVCHAFGISMKTDTNAVKLDYQMPALYPYGIYTIPEISMIGRTEEELVAQKIDYVVGKSHYKELARGQIVGDRWGILKLVVDRKTLKILGVHICGDNAADLIHIGQAVMAFGGDVTYFINSVFNYPTLAEAYKTAAFQAVNAISSKTSKKSA